MHEEPHYHHPPYAWLGAAVLLWGMVAFLLAPTVWTWVRASPRTMTAAVPGSDDGWILWKHIPAQGEGVWYSIRAFAQEPACEEYRAHFQVREQKVNGFTGATMHLACLPWHINPYGSTVLPVSAETADTNPHLLRTVTVLPTTCQEGARFFVRGAPPGANVYVCTAPNVLTLQGEGPGPTDFDGITTGTVTGPLVGTGTATTYTLERQP
jgi:hypothetical protein